MPKPFSPRELLARLRAVLRRAQPSAVEAEIVIGRVAIDVGARRVRVGGEPVDLTGLEFDILLALARRPGRVVPRETLLGGGGAERRRRSTTAPSTCTCRTCARSWVTIRGRRA